MRVSSDSGTAMKNIMKKFGSFDTRTKMLAGLTAAVLFIFIFEKFFFAGLRLRIKTIDREIKVKEVGLKTAISIQGKKDTIEADYKAYKDYIEKGGDIYEDICCSKCFTRRYQCKT